MELDTNAFKAPGFKAKAWKVRCFACDLAVKL